MQQFPRIRLTLAGIQLEVVRAEVLPLVIRAREIRLRRQPGHGQQQEEQNTA
jgi:hypothetical protein